MKLKYFFLFLVVSISFHSFAMQERNELPHKLFWGRHTAESAGVFPMPVIGRSCSDLPLFNQSILQMQERKNDVEAYATKNNWAVAELIVSYKREPRKLIQVKNNRTAEKVFRQMWDKDLLELQEQIGVLFLDKANNVIGFRTVSTGSGDQCLVDTKLILSIALRCMAHSIIIAHNHPSGNLNPSPADYLLTDSLRSACQVLNIELIDHLIITAHSFASISEAAAVETISKKAIQSEMDLKQIKKKLAILEKERTVSIAAEPDVEIWKDIPGYEGLYQVSSFGRVKSLYKEKMLTLFETRKKYLRAYLYKDGIRSAFAVHRLVAMVFIINSENKPEVNHKDGKKDNNYLSNLEWSTTKENVRHRFDILHHKQPCGIMHQGIKSVIATPVHGGNPMRFDSIRIAVENLGLKSHGNISSCLKGRRKHSGGYVWKYAEKQN